MCQSPSIPSPTQATSKGSLTETRPQTNTKGERPKARAASSATHGPERGSTVSAKPSIKAIIARADGNVEAQLPRGSQADGSKAVKPPISQ